MIHFQVWTLTSNILKSATQDQKHKFEMAD